MFPTPNSESLYQNTETKNSKKIPIRSILIIPFLIQIFAAVGLTGYFSLRNGQKAVNNLADKLRTEVSDRIDQRLDTHMETARRVVKNNRKAVELNLIDLENTEQIGRYFFHQVHNFDLGYLLIGFKSGKHVSSGHFLGDEVVTIDEVNAEKYGDTKLHVYKPNKQGDRGKEFIDGGETFVDNQFSLQNEGWFKEPLKKGEAVWTPVYNWQVEPFPLSVAHSTPIYDKKNNIIAVIAVEQQLSQISDFLGQLKVSPEGKTFIIERNGLLVGDSAKEKPFKVVNGKPERLKATDSKDLLIQSTAQYLQHEFNSFQQIKGTQQLNFKLNGERQFVQVTPWQDELGLDWLVVVAVPESDFMGQINANTRSTIMLCLLALGVAIASGFYTSRWITKPILQLNQASEAIASGELDQKVDEEFKVNELSILSRSFNRMADQLRSSFSALAETNVELEKRVTARTVELKEAKEVADSANQAKSEFLANMSHELRTPLNGILGYAQILQQSRSLEQKERKGVNIIHQSGTHLLTLINDILDLSKIEARKMELHPVELHFPSFLQGVVEICQVKAEQKEIQFDYEPDPNLPVGIKADAKMLRQVIMNLLSNAIKFTETGSVKLTVSQCDGKDDNNLKPIRFTVEDSGIGMNPEDVAKIFLPFEQVGSFKKQAEGTGLGLAISQKMVKMMGGELKVESEYHQGTTFWFEIALEKASNWEQQTVSGSGSTNNIKQSRISGYKGAKHKILAVDDLAQNTAVIINLLEPLGFEMKAAENGEDGLSKAIEWQPDVIITDLSMPVMDGHQMIAQLRLSSQISKDMIVIVSSARVFESDRQKSLEAGANDFLPKPVQKELLLQSLQKYLHLEWTYEAELENNISSVSPSATAEAKVTASELTTAEIVPPAPDEVEMLYDLSRKGLVNNLLEEIDRIEALDPQLKPFAHSLRELAQGFKLRQIKSFIEQFL